MTTTGDARGEQQDLAAKLRRLTRATKDPSTRWAVLKDVSHRVPDPLRPSVVSVGKKAFWTLPVSMRRQVRAALGHPATQKQVSVHTSHLT